MAVAEAAEANRNHHRMMKPRPMYRWKSFWLGVLVLAFSGWAWWSSHEYESYAAGGQFAVVHQAGHVGVLRTGYTPARAMGHVLMNQRAEIEVFPLPFLIRGRGLSDLPPFDRSGTFKQAVEGEYLTYPVNCWALFFPHWVLAMVFGVAWVSFLGWRWRKQRRLTKSMVA